MWISRVLAVLMVATVVCSQLTYKSLFTNLRTEVDDCVGKFVCNTTKVNSHCAVECIDKAFLCDGIIDCSNAADEYYCPTIVVPACDCGPGEYLCQDNVTCINRSMVCDGIIQCNVHGDDEDNCVEPCVCTAGSYVCTGNLTNIPVAAYCDGVLDCPDGDDEPGRCICETDPVTAPAACLTIADGIDNADLNRLIGTIATVDYEECKAICCFMDDCDAFILEINGNCALMDTKAWNRLTSNFVDYDGDIDNCEIRFYSVLN